MDVNGQERMGCYDSRQVEAVRSEMLLLCPSEQNIFLLEWPISSDTTHHSKVVELADF
jgi:hypothetical protein